MTQSQNGEKHPPKNGKSGDNHSRLDGWKEIADYMRRSVRTVQRWEEELGLPVHRFAGRKRDSVFAIPTEIDAWMEKHSVAIAQSSAGAMDGGKGMPGPAHSQPAQEERRSEEHPGKEPSKETALTTNTGDQQQHVWWRKRTVQLVVTAIIVLATTVGAGFALRSAPQPAKWKVEGNTLKVFDAKNTLLWEHPFDVPIGESNYLAPIPDYGTPFVVIEDLDGDDENEVLFILISSAYQRNEFYCFNNDGKVRFKHQTNRSVRFGDEVYDPPFLPRYQLVTPEPDGKKTIWLGSQHNLMFPSMVEKITPRGEAVGEYWTNGHINNLKEGRLNGRRVILVATMYNDEWRTSLAALDYDNPSGSAPSEKSYYRCRNCPAGQPLAFFVFPRMEISREMERRPTINEVRVGSDWGIRLTVLHAWQHMLPDASRITADAIYTFGPDLHLIEAETGDAYHGAHNRLELAGRIKHRYGPQDEKELLPVLKWDGGKLVPLMPQAQHFATAAPNSSAALMHR